MRYWLTAIAALVLAIAGGWFFVLNQGEILVRVTPALTVGAPLGVVLLIAFLLGAGAVAVGAAGGALARGWRALGARRRDRRARRGHDALARARELLWWGETRAARAQLLRAPDDPASEAARCALLAETHLEEGEPARAREVLERVRPAAAGEPRLLELAARAAEALGNQAAALDTLERARRARPGSPRLAARLRDLYAAAGRWQDAAAVQAEVLLGAHPAARLAAEHATLVGLRYEACMQEPDPALAAGRLRALAREAPDFLPAWVGAGDRYARAGHESTARRVWVRGLRRRPAAVLLDRIAALDAAAGRPQRTGQLLRGVARRHGHPAAVVLRLARQLLADGEPDRAAAVLDQLSGDAAGLAHGMRAEIARVRGDERAAVEGFARALGPDLGLSSGWCCAACGAVADGWHARCPRCGRWDSVHARGEDARWSGGRAASDPLIRPAN